MVRGGVEHSETEGIRKSVFDKVNRNADINPQKGRHLLCSFCPCEKRKQGETSGNAARDKPAVSRTAVCRRFLSCIIFPQNHRYIFSAKKCNETPYNPSVMLCMTAPFAQGSHGWGGLRCHPLHKGTMVGAACVAVLCTRELRWGGGRGLLSRKMRCTETVVAALPLAKVFCKEIKILLKQKPVLHGNSARDGSIFLPSEFREPKRRAFCRDWQIYPCGGGFSCPRISLRCGGICPAFFA